MSGRVIDTKERILEAGLAIIAAKSFHGCGLTEILERARVPKGSFYHHFQSKEDLGVAVIERAAEAHVQFMQKRLSDRSLSPLSRVKRLFREMRDQYADSGGALECLVAKLALEVAQLSEPMRATIKYAYDHWSSVLARTLREAQAAGELGNDQDLDEMAAFMIAAWEGVTVRMRIVRSVKPLDQYIDRMNRMLPGT